MLQPDDGGALERPHPADGEQDAGVGSALLGAGEGTLADELGFAEAVLWVLEANAPARAFYEHKGWRLDDGRRDTGWGPTVRYRRALR